MANLVVRNLDDNVVHALKKRAAMHGRSAEAEHREILARALQRPQRKTFAQVLMAMPDVGEDDDFARDDDGETARVFA
ncbi:MAG: DNA-binding protein [Methylobacillus sp.]|jgi:plasmid stability protein|nr:DNA-binding protein [Methylobacillus sp.]